MKRLFLLACLLASSVVAVSVAAAVPVLAQEDEEQRDCADFDSQEEAQRFYDEHKDDEPNDPDPYDLDTDGDGKACEGLPTTAGAATPDPAPSPTATPAAERALPKNGVSTGVMALSGISLLEAGYALTLASKRLGVRRRSIPLYLLNRLVRAAKHGESRVEIAQDVYLVHRSALDEHDTPASR